MVSFEALRSGDVVEISTVKGPLVRAGLVSGYFWGYDQTTLRLSSIHPTDATRTTVHTKVTLGKVLSCQVIRAAEAGFPGLDLIAEKSEEHYSASGVIDNLNGQVYERWSPTVHVPRLVRSRCNAPSGSLIEAILDGQRRCGYSWDWWRASAACESLLLSTVHPLDANSKTTYSMVGGDAFYGVLRQETMRYPTQHRILNIPTMDDREDINDHARMV